VKTFPKFLPVLSALAIVGAIAFTGHLVKEAFAADQWIGQLSSTDAGATNVLALPPQSPGVATAGGALNQQFDIWCAIPACFKTDTLASGVVGDGGINCASDVPAFVYNGASLANQNASGCTGLGYLPRCRFTGGKHLGIVALAADAGNPACVVSTVIGGG
jgi:hypothetical protein